MFLDSQTEIILPIKQKRFQTNPYTSADEAPFFLEDMNYGNFKSSLSREIERSAIRKIIPEHTKIEIPFWINKEQKEKYFQGFLLYITGATERYADISENLTEEQIYFAAVVAYVYDDIKALSNLDNFINKLSDTYYWLYLSKEPKLFRSTMEIEMYRRRTINTLKLSSISISKYKELNTKNILKIEEGNCTSKRSRDIDTLERFIPHYLGYCEFPYRVMNINLNLPQQAIQHYTSKVADICKFILQTGCVIAGGFPNSLINPVYDCILIEWDKIKFSDTGANFYRYILPIGIDKKLIRRKSFGSTQRTRQGIIPGIEDCIKAFFCQRFPPEKTKRVNLEEQREKYKNYNLEENLEKYKQYLKVIGESLYRLYYRCSSDIDVFLVDQDYRRKTNDIVSYILNQDRLGKVNFHYSEFATTIKLGRNYPNIQIIKRVYSNTEEILAGFDLDASRVAMVGNIDNIIAPKAYIKAVKYGVNLIVPSRQSLTFNYRLQKYYSKGYEGLIPGDIIRRFDFRKWKRISENPLRGTLAEFFLNYSGEDYVWNYGKVSDYESKASKEILDHPYYKDQMESKVVPIDERKQLIDSKCIVAGKKDVLYLANKLSLDIYKNNQNNVTDKVALQQRIFIIVNSLFWRTTDPSTQYTGSFNPTELDYTSNNKLVPIPTVKSQIYLIVSTILINYIADIVEEYVGEDVEDYYWELKCLTTF